MDDKIGIVSFANNQGNYKKMLERLSYSLDKIDFKGERYFYSHEQEVRPDCPFHSSEDQSLFDRVVPYGFKPYAMQNAIDDGCDIVIWMDSAIYATKNIDSYIGQIKKDGYVFFDNIGFTVGDYTSDKCLNYYGWTRDKAFNHKMIMACIIGLDIRNPKAQAFFNKYFQSAKNKVPYRGSWNNNGDVSPDPRVKGHRHDQSCASIIIADLGLKILTGQDTYFAYAEHRSKMRISETVCLWSEGL